MYAIIKAGGKQYRVEPGAQLRVESLKADVGAAVSFGEVLFIGDGDAVKVGAPLVSGAQVNATVENIGARRLQTVLERVLDEISFDATDKGGETIVIDAAYVEARIGDLAKNADLSKFIL